MMRLHTFKPFDIVVAPFPFTEKAKTKKRPLVVLSCESFSAKTHVYVCAMITSALHVPWHLDTPIDDLKKAGLLKSSIIRLKLFTLDAIIIEDIIGHLSSKDQKAVIKNLKSSLQLR